MIIHLLGESMDKADIQELICSLVLDLGFVRKERHGWTIRYFADFENVRGLPS